MKCIHQLLMMADGCLGLLPVGLVSLVLPSLSLLDQLVVEEHHYIS